MRSLRASLIEYKESSDLLSTHAAEQTGDISETLELQRKELTSAGKSLAFKATAEKEKIGRTGLATVGGAQLREIEREQEDFGVKVEGVELKSAQEKEYTER